MGKRIYPIVVLGDTHFPFHSESALTKSLNLIKFLKPKIVIQIGDLYDFYAYSRFPKRIRLTADDEVKLARTHAENMWRDIRKTAKGMKCYQIKGNHCDRASKRLTEQLPEFHALAKIDPLWEFKGVTTVPDSRDVLELGNIIFQHGHYSKLGDHLKHNEFKNSVCGHSHRGGVYYHRIADGSIRWELNAGYLADAFSPELNYRPSKKFFSWTHGVGVIDELGPRFCPL